MPTQIRNVIVFGDSLSDIGKKWKTGVGRLALRAKAMYVSPTGRFSDCRNWTDFMYEEATEGKSLIGATAEDSITNSQKHTTLTSNGNVKMDVDSFIYTNYAEGGACGDKPKEKANFLGTFEEQIDAFEKDRTALLKTSYHFKPDAPTLFIIWFGANDLFTANRPYREMGQVAEKVAGELRKRLNTIVQNSWFIFVNLSRPLTLVRYQVRKNAAIEKVSRAKQGKNPITKLTTKRNLDATEKEINDLAEGVSIFNTKLESVVKGNRDRVVKLDTFITEDSLNQLIEAHLGLDAGAEDKPSTTHHEPIDYRTTHTTSKLTVIDQVHPSDRAYELIWKLIRKEIKNADCTFGNLFKQRQPDESKVIYKKMKEIKRGQPTPFDQGMA